jgi:hypothetical protein
MSMRSLLGTEEPILRKSETHSVMLSLSDDSRWFILSGWGWKGSSIGLYSFFFTPSSSSSLSSPLLLTSSNVYEPYVSIFGSFAIK